VKDTAYRTLAERKPNAADYPDAHPSMLRAGSSVFVPTSGPVALNDPLQWWAYIPGANWKRPEGPASGIIGREDHPVVHIAYEDAQVYADWCDKRLPSEAEWEFAARGGLDRATYAWGNELYPEGVVMANIWQGEFPWKRSKPGRVLTTPVRSFPANAFGLYDMIGNVWEWTADDFGLMTDPARNSCCARAKASVLASDSPPLDGSRRSSGSTKTIKGGSHLCAESYCRRYRPAARHPQTIDTSTSHIGFRCARSV
jgi:formylglycine-generating enzyme required for sulfatase activity